MNGAVLPSRGKSLTGVFGKGARARPQVETYTDVYTGISSPETNVGTSSHVYLSAEIMWAS